MFLGNFSQLEKDAFLCLAKIIIHADGIIDELEISVLNNLLSEMRVNNTDTTISETESYNILAASNNSVKRAVYVELLSLAMADGKIDPSESACIRTIANKLNLSDSFIKDIEVWLINYFDILKKGLSIVEGND